MRVLDSENSGNLSVFSLEEFFHGNTFELVHGVGINVDLNPLLPLDFRPPLFELFLHLAP